MEDLKQQLKAFTTERDWDSFHNPKNLLLSLFSEVGELADLFRWLTPEESTAAMKDSWLADQVEQEIADVFNNLLLLAMKLDIDLVTASKKKIKLNEKKYPANQWKGKTWQKKIMSNTPQPKAQEK
ncbi:MAG: nucleotide pyrophosphohydrolase [Chlamydiota bacterium]